MACNPAGDQGVALVIFANPSSTSCTASKPSIRFDISNVGVTTARLDATLTPEDPRPFGL